MFIRTHKIAAMGGANQRDIVARLLATPGRTRSEMEAMLRKTALLAQAPRVAATAPASRAAVAERRRRLQAAKRDAARPGPVANGAAHAERLQRLRAAQNDLDAPLVRGAIRERLARQAQEDRFASHIAALGMPGNNTPAEARRAELIRALSVRDERQFLSVLSVTRDGLALK